MHTSARAIDPRLEAFCSEVCPDLFHGVVHPLQIFHHDPYDVPAIHEEAREKMTRLLVQAGNASNSSSAKFLLLKGEAGSGKTHLMRAFRTQVVTGGAGYFSYMQMTTESSDYLRYLLVNLVDSLDQPYDEIYSPESSLVRLSNRLVGNADLITPEAAMRLREGDFDPQLVMDLARDLTALPALRGVSSEFWQALLYLQRGETELHEMMGRYFRCRVIAKPYLDLIGNSMAPHTGEGAAREMIQSIARVMKVLDGASLVICMDQLENCYDPALNVQHHFQQGIRAVCEVFERVPNAIVVIACLEDFYTVLRPHFTQSYRDRIELDPDPVLLRTTRNEQDVRALLAKRLDSLYEVAEVTPPWPEESVFPFSETSVQVLANMPTRQVLDACRRAREHSQRTQRAPEISPPGNTSTDISPSRTDDEETSLIALAQKWNDFLISYQADAIADDASQANTLRLALEHCAKEWSPLPQIQTASTDSGFHVALGGGSTRETLLVAICNRAPQGGRLGSQIETAQSQGETLGRVPVIVRSTPYPGSTARAQISQILGRLIAKGGRRVVISAADWRAMQAMKEFALQHGGSPYWTRWLQTDKPVSRLQAIETVTDKFFNRLPTSAPEEAPKQPDPSPAASPASPPPLPGAPPRGNNTPTSRHREDIVLGPGRDFHKTPVSFSPQDLTRHAAILGGTGSGKTTLVLNMIEQLLEAGTPAILIDRKGDLCSYADPRSWEESLTDTELTERRARLRERLDVAVYTPGAADGRPLGISVLPQGLPELPPGDQENAARFAAEALAGMMGYRSTADTKRSVILQQAIKVFTSMPSPTQPTLERLLDFIADEDPLLLNEIGHLDPKNVRKLVQDLQALILGNRDLLSSLGEPMDIERLLGLGSHQIEGKTRLSIISTKFLQSQSKVLFYVSQFLIEFARYASKHPSNQLQAVVLFDEADMYLPATSRPSTKEPMENALKRFRSAGIGILLATQNPGDLDYKCRDNIQTWCVGRVKEENSLKKMRPMMSEARSDVTAKLPQQTTGQFYVVKAGKEPVSLQANMSLVRALQLSDQEILNLAAG